MRRRSTLWAALSAAALLAALAAPPAHAKRVRVFAMQPKLNVSWLESRQTYRDKLFALFDRRLRGPGKPLIQRGADDAASHLRGGGRDLVLWPESLGLFAALTGERARSSRTAGSLEGAIVSILGSYAPQNAYYGARYPALAARFPPTRLLALSLTDTFGRTVLEPLAEIADRYDVYLEMGVDMAQDWRVVCVNRSTFRHARLGCDEQSPAKVLQLRDPGEPARDYAYEATTDRASVMALLFGPDGRLIAKRIKSYIVPVEAGPTEGEVGLDLVPGSPSERRSDVRPLHTPVGTLGFVVSKPAWIRRRPEAGPAARRPAGAARVLRRRPGARRRQDVGPRHAARLRLRQRAAAPVVRGHGAAGAGRRGVRLLRRRAEPHRGQAAAAHPARGLPGRPASPRRADAGAALGGR